MFRKIFRKICCLIVFLFLAQIAVADNVATLTFQTDGPLFINGYESIPPVSDKQKTYEAVTLNTRGMTAIRVGNETKTVRLKHIHKRDFLTLKLGNKSIRLILWPKRLPSFKVEAKAGKTPGLLLFAPYVSCQPYPSYAMAVDTDGNLVFYHSMTGGGGYIRL